MKHYYLKMMYDGNDDKGMVVGEVEYDERVCNFYSMGIKDLEYFCKVVPSFKNLNPHIVEANLATVEYSLKKTHEESFVKVDELIKRMNDDDGLNGLFTFVERKF